MKKIELNQKKLELKKETIVRLNKNAAAAPSEEPTTTVILSIQHRCIPDGGRK